ncbi:MAG: hypothetical protein HY608_00465 [Planctomycetes bacterium]|nr:hypothetical protein [Planctomycetota bacterium]
MRGIVRALAAVVSAALLFVLSSGRASARGAAPGRVEATVYAWRPSAKGDAALGEAVPAQRFDLHDHAGLEHTGVGEAARLVLRAGRWGFHAGASRAHHDRRNLLTQSLSVQDRTYAAGTSLRGVFDLEVAHAAFSLAHGWGVVPDAEPTFPVQYEVRALVGASTYRWETRWDGAGGDVTEAFRADGATLGFSARFWERWGSLNAQVLGSLLHGRADGTGVEGDLLYGARWGPVGFEAGWHQVWMSVASDTDSVDVAYGGPLVGLRWTY